MKILTETPRKIGLVGVLLVLYFTAIGGAICV
jgi:hypothetical protein